MPFDFEEYMKRIESLKDLSAKANSPEAEDLSENPTPIVGGAYSVNDFGRGVSDFDLHPSKDIENEALHNSLTGNRFIDLHGNDASAEDLDDATWHDKLFGLDSNGKLIRKTIGNRPLFAEEALTGEDAQDARHIQESAFGWLPFIGRLGSGETTQNGYFPYKDKDGKFYLKEIGGTEEELSKATQSVMSAYGPKPFSNSFMTNVTKGISKTVNTTDETMANFLELGVDLGEATTNAVLGKGFKSEEGATDKFAASIRANNQINSVPGSHASEGSALDGGEGLSYGIGSGVGSLLQFGAMGKVMNIGARAFLTNPKAIQTMSALGAGAILNTGEAYTAAKQNGLNEEDSAWLALSTGVVNTALERMLGANVVDNWLLKGGAQTVPELILKETGGKFTKEALDGATDGILKKARRAIGKFTETKVVGPAFEEGLEEAAQGLSLKSAQIFYDSAVASGAATPGNGKFGTEFNEETWKDVFSDALVGAIVGGSGGVVAGRKNRAEEDTIVPLISAGKTQQVMDSVDMLHSAGKLNDYQREKYKERIQKLDDLWKTNGPAFAKLATEDEAEVLKAGALRAINDEFESHKRIDQLTQERAGIIADKKVSGAVKQQQAKLIDDAIEVEKQVLAGRTQAVRDFMPDSNGVIPAVEALKQAKEAAANPVPPTPAAKTSTEKKPDLFTPDFVAIQENIDQLKAKQATPEGLTIDEEEALEALEIQMQTKPVEEVVEEQPASDVEFFKVDGKGDKHYELVLGETVTKGGKKFTLEENEEDDNAIDLVAPDGKRTTVPASALKKQLNGKVVIYDNEPKETVKKKAEVKPPVKAEAKKEVITKLEKAFNVDINANIDGTVEIVDNGKSKIDPKFRVLQIAQVEHDLLQAGYTIKDRKTGKIRKPGDNKAEKKKTDPISTADLLPFVKVILNSNRVTETLWQIIGVESEGEGKGVYDQVAGALPKGTITLDNIIKAIYELKPEAEADKIVAALEELVEIDNNDKRVVKTPTGTPKTEKEIQKEVNFYREVQTELDAKHPKAKTILGDIKNLIDKITGAKAKPVYTLKHEGGHFNIYAETAGESVFVGYLAPTEGKAALKKDASAQQKAAHAKIVSIKERTKREGSVTLDLSVYGIINTGKDLQGNQTEYTDKPLSELGEEFMYTQNDYIIYENREFNTQGKLGSTKEAIVGKGSDAHRSNPGFMNAGYVLVVKDAGGNDRFIALRPKAPLSKAGYEKLNEIIKNKNLTDAQKQEALNATGFTANNELKNKGHHIRFRVYKGDIYMSVTKDGGINEEVAKIKIKGELSAENLDKALELKVVTKYAAEFKGMGLRDFLSGIHEQIGPKPSREEILSKLVPATGENLWRTHTWKVNDIVEAQKPAVDPQAEAMEKVKATPNEKPKPAEKKKAPTKEELEEINKNIEKKKSDEEPDFSLHAGEKLQDTNWTEVEAQIAKILPSWFTIKNIKEMTEHVYTDGQQTLGAFVDDVIYLADKIAEGTGYHEAFHAVFKKLLTKEEQARYFAIAARKVDTSFTAIARFKTANPRYGEKSNKEVKLIMIEEYMADNFQAYMNGKPVTMLEGLYRRLKEILAWFKGERDELRSLFKSIDNGNFKNAKTNGAVPQVAFKVLPYTTAKESDRIVRLITKQFMNLRNDIVVMKNFDYGFDPDIAAMTNTMIADLCVKRGLVETVPESKVDELIKEAHAAGVDSHVMLAQRGIYVEGDKYHKVVYQATPEIVAEVRKLLRYFEESDLIDEDGNSRLDDHSDVNETAERTFDANIFEQGGAQGVSSELKRFIGLATYTDEEGIEQVVDFFPVYSAMERALSNKQTWEEMEIALDRLAKNSLQIAAVKSDLEKQSLNFKKRFQHGFNKMKVDYVQVVVDQVSGEYLVFAANRNDVGEIQHNRFKIQFETLESAVQVEKAKALQVLNKKLKEKLGDLEGQELEDFVTEYTAGLHAIGMDLKRNFVDSVMRAENEDYEPKDKSESKNTRSLHKDVDKITKDILAGKNPFSERSVEEKEDKGTSTWAIRGLGNADGKFRDDIINTNFQNAEGKTVYSYVTPSFIKEVAEDIAAGKLNGKFDTEYFALNPLVAMSKVNPDMLNTLTLGFFNGVRENNSEEGVTFKHIDPKSNIIAQHAMFRKGFLVPFVLEAKSTSATVKMPVRKLVDANGVTAEALEYLMNFVKQEVQAVNDALNELDTLQDHELIEGYHFNEVKEGKKVVREAYINGKPNRWTREEVQALIDKGDRKTLPRAFQIHFPLTVEGKNLNEMSNAEILEKEAEIKHAFKEFVKAQGREYNKVLEKSGISEAEIKKLVADKKTLATYSDNEELARKMYINDFLLNDFIFSNSYAQLVRGREAKYKGPIDITKRGGGLIASGTSLLLDKKEYKMGIIQDDMVYIDPVTLDRVGPDFKDAKEINTTDGQGHITGERFKDILIGLGRANDETIKVLDQLIAGEDIAWDPKMFTANSIKNVYFDGNVYIKTSILPLFKQFTSIKNEAGEWVAKPGLEYYHDLRVKMEANGIDEMYHESAIKLGIQGKNFRGEDGMLPAEMNTITLQNKYWRLQVENPSGKTKVVHGTQLIQLIDSEAADTDKVEWEGKEQDLGVVRKVYQEMLQGIRTDALESADTFLKAIVDGKSVFIKKIQDTLEQSAADFNTIEYFKQLAGDPEFMYSQDLPHIATKAQELLFAHFNKIAFQQKAPGLKLSLYTAAGYTVPNEAYVEGGKEPKHRPLKIHRTKDGKLEYAECVISEEFLVKYDITLADLQGDKITPEMRDEILTMMGVRIPTQSHHSLLPFKVVGWLPAFYGSVVIAPSEFVYLSGTDYDIDTLYVTRKEFRTVKNDKEEVTEFHIYKMDKPVEDLWEDFKAYHKKSNKELDVVVKTLQASRPKASGEDRFAEALKIMGLPSTLKEFKDKPRVTNAARYNRLLDTNFSFLSNRAIETSTKTPATVESLSKLNKIIKAITGNTEEINTPYNWNTSRLSHWLNNAAGKANVGSAASVNRNSAFASKYKVQLKAPIIFDDNEYTGFENDLEKDVDIIQVDGKWKLGKTIEKRKADSLSSLVSAMVDNAKERLAAALNLRLNNLSTLSTMVGLGVGLNRTILFSNQPAMLVLSNEIEKRTTAINGDDYASYNMHLKLAIAIRTKISESKVDRGAVKNKVTSQTMLEDLNSPFTITLNEAKKLVEPITSANIHFYERQLQVLEQYNTFYEVSKGLTTVGHVLNLNKTMGTTIEEIDDIADAQETINGMTFPLNVQGALEADLNSKANIESYDKVREVFGEKFLSRKREFMKVIADVKKFGCKSGKFKKLNNSLVTFLGMQKLNEVYQDKIKMVVKDFQYLISDPEKNITKQYYRMLKIKSLESNPFLKQLNPVAPTATDPFFRLEYNSRLKTDPKFAEKLTDGFMEMRNHPNKDVQNFARDLVRYLIIKDGAQFLNSSFIKLLPPEAVGFYSDILKDVKKALNNNESLTKFYGKSFDGMVTLFNKIWWSNAENRKDVKRWGIDHLSFNKKALTGEVLKAVRKYEEKTGELTVSVQFAPEELWEENNLIDPKSKLVKFRTPLVFAAVSQAPGLDEVRTIWYKESDEKDDDGNIWGAKYKRLMPNSNTKQSLWHHQTLKDTYTNVKPKIENKDIMDAYTSLAGSSGTTKQTKAENDPGYDVSYDGTAYNVVYDEDNDLYKLTAPGKKDVNLLEGAFEEKVKGKSKSGKNIVLKKPVDSFTDEFVREKLKECGLI
jgi:hypothetical protein